MSGLYPPYILFDKLIKYFDSFYYTSPISKNCGINCETIWSTHDLTQFTKIKRKKKRKKRTVFGYIGTIDFSKMHPDFLTMTKNFDVDFLIIGEGCDIERMKKEADDRFTFTGLVKDIKPYLREMDVFFYPLNEKNFGTCEQVLGEALAAGVPCYVLDNPAEQYIVNKCAKQRDGLWYPDKKKVLKLYSAEKMLQKWNKVFKSAIKKEKKSKEWQGGDNPFLESLGPYAELFKEYIEIEKSLKLLFASFCQWSSESKGSIKQYAKYFPTDKYLKKWRDLL
jgi:hypothetical protein